MPLEAPVQESVIMQPQHVEVPYAMAKLEESARIIRQSMSELPTLRKRLERNIEDKPRAREIHGDLQNQHRRLLGALNAAALSLLEAEQEELASHTVSLSQSIKSFNLMTPDYTKLCEVLGDYLSRLPIVDHFVEAGIFGSQSEAASDVKTTNNRIIGHLMNKVRMGYYPTCTDNLAHIVQGIEFPESATANLLDPCCGCGIALRFMGDEAKDNGADVKTYGIELDRHRAEEALTRLDRVGSGSFFHSRTSTRPLAKLNPHIIIAHPSQQLKPQPKAFSSVAIALR